MFQSSTVNIYTIIQHEFKQKPNENSLRLTFTNDIEYTIYKTLNSKNEIAYFARPIKQATLGKGNFGQLFNAWKILPDSTLDLFTREPSHACKMPANIQHPDVFMQRLLQKEACESIVEEWDNIQLVEEDTYKYQRNALYTYIFMPKAPGTDLLKHFNSGVLARNTQAARDFSLANRLNMVCMLLQDLNDRYHEKQITHRDLKLANIVMLITTAESVPKIRIIDNGLILKRDATEKDKKGKIGTLIFAAPETLSENGITTPKSDVYAMSLIIANMLGADKCSSLNLDTIFTPFSLPTNNPAGVHGKLNGTQEGFIYWLICTMILKMRNQDPEKRPNTALCLQFFTLATQYCQALEKKQAKGAARKKNQSMLAQMTAIVAFNKAVNQKAFKEDEYSILEKTTITHTPQTWYGTRSISSFVLTAATAMYALHLCTATVCTLASASVIGLVVVAALCVAYAAYALYKCLTLKPAYELSHNTKTAVDELTTPHQTSHDSDPGRLCCNK